MNSVTLLFLPVFLVGACNVYGPELLANAPADGAGGLAGNGGASSGTGGAAGSTGSTGTGSRGITDGTGSGGAGNASGGGGSPSADGSTGDAPSAGAGGAAGSGGAAVSGGGGSSDGATDSVIDRTDAVSDAPIADGSPDAASDALDATAETADGTPDARPCAGFAISLTGRTYGQVSRPVQDDFTLEAWIKTSTSRAGSNVFDGLPVLYSDRSGPSNDFGTTILNISDASTGPGRFGFFVGNPSANPNTDLMLLGTSVVTTNEWVHVAVTRSAITGALQLLINGALEASLSTSQRSPLIDAPNLFIGGNPVTSRFFAGLIDEVRVWNIVRTASEITATMHQLLRGTEAGLVGYWRFDDVGGTTALDSSPRNAAAALVGNPAWVASDAPLFCSP